MESDRIKNRSSNFELLRMIAMLMIVASHYAAHGIEKATVMDEAFLVWGTGTALRRAFTSFLNPGGEIGVALLFMITGYFLIRREGYSLKKTVLECVYYSVFAIVLCAVGMMTGGIPYMAGQNIVAFLARSIFMPMTSTAWWFVAVYVFLMLFSPVLNSFLRKLNQKGFLLLLICGGLVWYCLAGFIGTGFFDLQKAAFFYTIGAYISRFGAGKKVSGWILCPTAFLAWTGSAACFYLHGMQCFAGKGGGLADRVILALGSDLFVPLCAVTVFLFFRSLPVRQSNFINTAAATTFGIYLIHDSLIARPLIWYRWLRVAETQYFASLYPLRAVVTIVGIYAVCAALDFIRLKFAEPVMMKKADKLLQGLRQRFLQS